MITRVIVGLVLLFGILLLTLPKSDEKSLARIASGSMLMCTLDLRKQVEQQLIKEEVVSVRFNNTCPDLIATLDINERGGMVLTGRKYQLKMTLNPVLENGKVHWSCSGEPAASVTKLCKP